MGAGPLAVGGGGVVGIIVLLFSLFSGGGGDLSNLQLGTGEPTTDLSKDCQTGEDANQRDDCRIVAVINSVQEYWGKTLPGYRKASTVFFDGSVSTGCGNATSSTGPFYCPPDQKAYIDLGFYQVLREQFGARGGPFAEAYVIAHEYGHHVQNLQGTLQRAQSGATGPQSEGVRVELQADCLAGMWARGAVNTGFIEELTQQDISDGLDAAAAVGDDRIQEKTQGRVDPESWTHGSAAQRQKWFNIGYGTSNIGSCDTFSVAAP
jgi:predicted metalloprotease